MNIQEWRLARDIPADAPLDWTNKHGMTQLHLACRDGNRQICEWLLSIGHPINVRSCSDEGRTPFHNLVMYNHFELARWFVQDGCLHAQDAPTTTTTPTLPIHMWLNKFGGSSLAYAAESASFEMFEWLLSLGCSTDDDEEGWSLVMWTISRNDQSVEILDYLIERGLYGSLDIPSNSGGNFLHLAAAFGNLPALKYLHNKFPSLDLNATTNGGLTIMMKALAHCHVHVAKWLIEEHGQSVPTHIWPNNQHAMAFAAVAGRVDVLQWLVDDCGCDLTMVGFAFHNIVANAAGSNQVAVLEWLSNERELSLHIVDENGATPLSVAASRGHFEAFVYIHEHQYCAVGDDCVLMGGGNHYCKMVIPISYACAGGQLDFCNKMLNAGALGDYDEEYGFQAAGYGRLEVLQWFAEKFPTSFHQIIAANKSCFISAASRGQIQVLEWLFFKSQFDFGVEFSDIARLVDTAVYNNQKAVLQFFNDNGLFSFKPSDICNTLLLYAGEHGSIDCFKWLLKRCRAVDVTAIAERVSVFKDNVVSWIEENKLLGA